MTEHLGDHDQVGATTYEGCREGVPQDTVPQDTVPQDTVPTPKPAAMTRGARPRRDVPTSATVAAFADDLAGHGGNPERISDTSSDMSQAFIAGIGAHLPNATLTFDRYHVIATRLPRPTRPGQM